MVGLALVTLAIVAATSVYGSAVPVPSDSAVTVAAKAASSAPPGASATATVECSTIDECNFDQQCVNGTCRDGVAPPQGTAGLKNPSLQCTESGCVYTENLIDNSNLALLSDAYSPYTGAGKPPFGSWVEGWSIESPGGVSVLPLGGAGGRAWQSNEVAVLSRESTAAFTYSIPVVAGQNVTVSFMLRDSQGSSGCTAQGSLILYVEAQSHRYTVRVLTAQGRRRASVKFTAEETGDVELKFSTHHFPGYYGCGPAFSTVQAIV